MHDDQQNAQRNVKGDVAKHNTRSHVCFSAKNVAESVFVFPLASMETSKFALATITGRQREEDQNALRFIQLNLMVGGATIYLLLFFPLEKNILGGHKFYDYKEKNPQLF